MSKNFGEQDEWVSMEVVRRENSNATRRTNASQVSNEERVAPEHKPPFIYTDHFLPFYKGVEPPINESLSIAEFRSLILDTIGSNQVTIINGATGCGKTTQVPQYILDWYAARNFHCNIVVVQPRRLSTVSVAERVCDERKWEMGGLCGFKVGFDNHTTSDTRLTYLTTGVFLQIVLNCGDLSKYTHVILDEVHERDQLMDFCICVINNLLSDHDMSTKIILMSATADFEQLGSYFERVSNGVVIPAPILDLSQNTNHEVKIYYLEDLDVLGDIPFMHYSKPFVLRSVMKFAVDLLDQFDFLDFYRPNKYSVLIFLPGLLEIQTMCSFIEDHLRESCGEEGERLWEIVPSHSTLSPEEQYMVYAPSDVGKRKIIIATNMAESSITIPDLGVVIDFGLQKVLMKDSRSNLTNLTTVWTSRSNLEQRAGRVGRVGKGLVYRLFPESFVTSKVDCFHPPDIKECVLQKTVLSSVMFRPDDPEKFLAKALDPPENHLVKASVLSLKELIAIPLTVRYPDSQRITFLGRLMTTIPVDIEYTRLMIFGYIFGVFEESIIMASGFSQRGLFSNSINENLNVHQMRLKWADGSCSDGITILNIYRTWKRFKDSGYFDNQRDGEEVWAKKQLLNIRVLREFEKFVKELTNRFRQKGIAESPNPEERVRWEPWEEEFITKLVLGLAFYPNYFRQADMKQCFERNACNAVWGRDPFRVAFMNGFPTNKNFNLYADVIKDYASMFDEDVKISTNYNGKVFLEFPRDEESYEVDPEVPFNPRIVGGIPKGVYYAHWTKFFQRKYHLDLVETMSDLVQRVDELWARKKEEEFQAEEFCVPKTVTFDTGLPPPERTDFPVKVTVMFSPNEFWCVPVDKRGLKLQRQINDRLNVHRKRLEMFREPPKRGQLCVIVGADNNLYRGKVVHVMEKSMEADLERGQLDRKLKRRFRRMTITGENTKSWRAKVFLFDTGETKFFEDHDVMKCSIQLFNSFKNLPALAFPCTLKSVRASPYLDAKNRWLEKGIEAFRDVLKGADLKVTVYSVVSGVASVDLYTLLPGRKDEIAIHINQHMVDLEYAIKCQESWLSEKYYRSKNGHVNPENYKAWEERGYYHVEEPSSFFSDYTADLDPPESPLAVKLKAYVYGRLGQTVLISGRSVNAALLDPYSRDRSARMFVAGYVSQSRNQRYLTLNDTTWMPNIPGWAWILPLLVAPRGEYRVDEARTQYTGAICGLGMKEDGFRMYANNDSELMFDVEITQEDAVDINIVRYLSSIMLLEPRDSFTPADRFRAKTIVQECTRALLFKKRDRLTVTVGHYGAHSWNNTDWGNWDEAVMREIDHLSLLPHPLQQLNNENLRDYVFGLERVKHLSELMGNSSHLMPFILGIE